MLQGASTAEVVGWLEEEGLVVEEGGSRTLYRPLDVARGEHAMRLVVESKGGKGTRRHGDGTSSVRGFVDRSIPGDVRAWLADRSPRALQEGARIIHTGVKRKGARWALLAIAVLTGGIATARLVSNRRARRRLRDVHAPQGR